MTTAGMTSQHLSESHPSVEAISEVTLQSEQLCRGVRPSPGRTGELHHTFRHQPVSRRGLRLQHQRMDECRPPVYQRRQGTLIRPRQRNNDYGFSVGGPVWIPKVYNGRNKTFFFFNFDQFRNKSIVSGAAATVPTEAYRARRFQLRLNRQDCSPIRRDGDTRKTRSSIRSAIR